MCWNKDVSLNTFLFSAFVLALIVYNNYFTKYKIKELDNKWYIFFLASFISIQLIEFFIWKNIDNKYYNNIFSLAALTVFIIQPMISMMIMSNIPLRNILLLLYALLAIPYSFYKISTNHIHSVVSENGHLRWHFLEMPPFFWSVWIFFFLFSFVYEKKWFGLIFGLVTLIIAIVNYKYGNTMGSMWCWSVNSIMIYYAAYLLIFLPFLERASIC